MRLIILTIVITFACSFNHVADSKSDSSTNVTILECYDPCLPQCGGDPDNCRR